MTDEEHDGSDRWMTLVEIAEELRVNPATVRVWVSKGQLKASRAGCGSGSSGARISIGCSRRQTHRAPRRLRSARRFRRLRVRTAPTARRSLMRTRRIRGFSPRPERVRAPAELLQIANRNLNDAFRISAHAPPAPGYLDRLRAIADACEHVAATLRHASRVAACAGRDETTSEPRSCRTSCGPVAIAHGARISGSASTPRSRRSRSR